MKRLLAATETVAAIFLLLIALLTAGNVTVRGLLSVQIPDWFDGTKMLMAIALFWGIAVATYHAGHIAVDIVWEHLKAPGRRALDVLAGVITLAFLAPMAWMVFSKVLSSGTQATSDLRIPLMWFTAIAACGAVAAAVLALARVIELVRGHDPHDDLAGEAPLMETPGMEAASGSGAEARPADGSREGG